jgi:Flp pilus assembly protein TadD
MYQIALVEANLLAGHLGAADDLAQRALAVARQCGGRGFEARLLWLLGRIAMHREPPEVACHLGLGTLYRRTGQREQAREHLTTATVMYRAEAEMRGLT